MSMHEGDGIDEALEGVTQMALSAAARLGEQHARRREQQAREAQARSEQAAREQAERMAAERSAAGASLAAVHRREWWDTAGAEEVTKVYETARAWSGSDPEAVRAEQRIREEVRARYGVEVPTGGDPAGVAEAMDRAERARNAAEGERGEDQRDQAEAVSLMARAAAVDQEAEAERGEDPDGPAVAEELGAEGGLAYDSAERRDAMAEGLDHLANRAAVDARVRADVAQGRPAADAVAAGPAQAPRARKGRKGPQTAQKVQRGRPEPVAAAEGGRRRCGRLNPRISVAF